MKLLSSLPPLPARMRALPVDARGYPVPWFVAWFDANGRAMPRGQGAPDFRVIAPAAIRTAVTRHLYWVCGEKRGTLGAFLIGPMCAVNRVSAEPPSHPTCAEFSARACPFLANPKRKRNEKDMPEADVAGLMLKRNPGVALLWATRTFSVAPVDNGVLFDLGEPEFVRWFAEGRTATRAEVDASIASGLPLLMTEAERDPLPGAVEALREMIQKAERYLP